MSMQPQNSALQAPSPLANSQSPYVLSQRNSKIRWQLFGDDALQLAKTENKPIFLHIGYSASHYCYLTAQESFTNHDVIDLLNRYFIPIIVDREERPDLDNIYMAYVHSLSSVAGHPLNVFLTPELQPFYGGAYYPGPGAHQPSVNDTGEKVVDFLVVLQTVQVDWATQQDRLRQDGQQSVENLRTMIGEGTFGLHDLGPRESPNVEGQVDIDQLEEAYDHIFNSYDNTYGGFIHLPPNSRKAFTSGNVDMGIMKEAYDYIKKRGKFITPAKLSFLLRARQFPQAVIDVVGEDLSLNASKIALETLRHINAGGIHDHVGGGFHRCSVTRDWSLPTFEKMLSDNALSLGLYLDAWLTSSALSDGKLASKDSEFSHAVFELADYLTSSPILLESGGFATSEAADSYNKRGDTVLRHGAYYLWTRKEFDTVIGDEQEIAVASAHWDVQEHGNVDKDEDPNDEYLNQNVLRVVKGTADLSLQFHLAEPNVVKLIDSARRKLLAHREKERPRPAVDRKIITVYNGMAIAALARTAAACTSINETARGVKYLKAAEDAATFIKNELWDAERKQLYRMYGQGGRSSTEAFAEDHAFLVEGLLELYEATADELWLQWADEVQSTQNGKFYDDPESLNGGGDARCGAFYCTTKDETHILLRIKDAMDTSQPSTNAVSASNLFRLGTLLNDERYKHLAKGTINAFEAELLQHPHLFPGLLSSVVAWKFGTKRFVSLGGEQNESLQKHRLTPRGGIQATLHFKVKLDHDEYLNFRNPGFAEELVRKMSGFYSADN